MYVGDGSIFPSVEECLSYLKEKGYVDLKKIEIDCSQLMIYFVSSKGDVFGVQSYKGFFLVKKLTIKKTCKGCYFRISLGHSKQIFVYLAPLLYRLFIDNSLKEGTEVGFKDGNVSNYSLDNLEVKGKEVPIEFLSNMSSFQDVYEKLFMRCSYYTQCIVNLGIADCKDAASIAFYELCKQWNPSNLDYEYFSRCWFKRSELRALDILNRKVKYGGRVVFDNGDEVFGFPDSHKETFDLWSPLENFPTSKKYLKLRLQGYSNVEIGKMYGVASGTVGGSVSRALTLLKEYFKNDIQLAG